MCGRFALYSSGEALAEEFDLVEVPEPATALYPGRGSMNDTDRFQLFFSPYRSPPFRYEEWEGAQRRKEPGHVGEETQLA